MNKILLGISGVARTGKDTLCELLKNEFYRNAVTAERFSLADELKRQIRPTLIDKYGIDVSNCSAAEKEIIRPDLIEYGRVKREQSDGKFWTNFLEKRIEDSTAKIAIVTDVRYDYYKEDELFWLKQKHRGCLVHISRFYYDLNKEKKWVLPPNKEEAENDPKIKACADFKLEWATGRAAELTYLYDSFIRKVTEYAYTRLMETIR